MTEVVFGCCGPAVTRSCFAHGWGVPFCGLQCASQDGCLALVATCGAAAARTYDILHIHATVHPIQHHCLPCPPAGLHASLEGTMWSIVVCSRMAPELRPTGALAAVCVALEGVFGRSVGLAVCEASREKRKQRLWC
jgi:hypothetical protein